MKQSVPSHLFIKCQQIFKQGQTLMKNQYRTVTGLRAEHNQLCKMMDLFCCVNWGLNCASIHEGCLTHITGLLGGGGCYQQLSMIGESLLHHLRLKTEERFCLTKCQNKNKTKGFKYQKMEILKYVKYQVIYEIFSQYVETDWLMLLVMSQIAWGKLLYSTVNLACELQHTCFSTSPPIFWLRERYCATGPLTISSNASTYSDTTRKQKNTEHK